MKTSAIQNTASLITAQRRRAVPAWLPSFDVLRDALRQGKNVKRIARRMVRRAKAEGRNLLAVQLGPVAGLR
jgi:hypothetical protein